MLLLLPFVNASYYNLFCVGSWIEYDRFGWCSSLWWYIHVKCAIWPISIFVFVFVFFVFNSSVAIKQTKPSCIKRNSNLVCNLNALPILQIWCFRLFRSKIAYESLVSMDYRFGTNSNQMHQYNCINKTEFVRVFIFCVVRKKQRHCHFGLKATKNQIAHTQYSAWTLVCLPDLVAGSKSTPCFFFMAHEIRHFFFFQKQNKKSYDRSAIFFRKKEEIDQFNVFSIYFVCLCE